MSSNTASDITTIMLSQITNLQERVSKQDTIISALKAEIDKLSMTRPVFQPQGFQQGMPQGMPQGFQQGMPQAMQQGFQQGMPQGFQPQWIPRTPPQPTNKKMPDTPVKGRGPFKPKVAVPYPTMSISDVLNTDETVYMEIRTGKDSVTTAVSTFDGTNLTITEAELAKSIIGLSSPKPGEILYKFMESLHKDGHIDKTFGIAPWKLCFVKRDGVKKSLEELR